MVYKLDVRGLSCPEPVINTKRALAEHDGTVVVVADSFVAAENIRRLVSSLAYQITTEEEHGEFTITITK
ncbi:MAG TPA: sulfurtransferase TusA family protein [Oscillospiraceae bacterium]|nr:sulfurtransferase TusA family protein [Oscillospiraceae bacterium]